MGCPKTLTLHGEHGHKLTILEILWSFNLLYRYSNCFSSSEEPLLLHDCEPRNFQLNFHQDSTFEFAAIYMEIDQTATKIINPDLRMCQLRKHMTSTQPYL